MLITKHKTRGWQPLIDKLNQAKAYNYLASLGCTEIRFVPESKIKGQQTPDLEASAQSGQMLCEVKTINISDEEANLFQNGGVATTTDRLPPAFFRKLSCSVSQASAQMEAYIADAATKKLAYIIVNFDNLTHEYSDRYKIQIDKFMRYIAPPDLEVHFDIKEAFYNSRV